MATSRQPQFAQQRAIRRAGAGDLMRLSANYQGQVKNLTNEYDTKFAEYQKGVDEKMRPFDDAYQRYQSEQVPEYEAQLKAFQERFAAHQAQIDDIAANPLYSVTERKQVRRARGGKSRLVWDDVTVWKKRDIPTFTEKAPELGEAPKAPEIQKFDSGDIEQRRGLAKQEFDREVSERKSARMNAVQRGRGRSLLGGVQQ